MPCEVQPRLAAAGSSQTGAGLEGEKCGYLKVTGETLGGKGGAPPQPVGRDRSHGDVVQGKASRLTRKGENCGL